MIKNTEMEARQRDLRMMRYLLRTMEYYDIPARRLYEGCGMSSKTFNNKKRLALDGVVTKGGDGICQSTLRGSLAA